MMIKNKKKGLIIATIILDLMMCTSLIVLYGPWTNFRNFWITSTMTTMNHQYLAHLFYSDKMIAAVLADNYVTESGASTDTNLINTDPVKDTAVYESESEKQILKKDKGNDLYKVIDISNGTYKGSLVVVYDSSKIKLGITKYLGTKGQYVDTMALENKAVVAVNGGGFYDPQWMGNGGEPTGSLVSNGKIVWTSDRPTSGGVVGFDYNGKLILSKDNMASALTKYKLKDALEFGPFLIVNGKPSFIKGNGGWGTAPRTAIGQRQDGITLFLVIDGRSLESLGADMVDLTEIMTKYKVYNAVNMDGGSSTTLIVDNKLMNKPTAKGRSNMRAIADCWLVLK